jgi:hypothetical protein
MVTGRAAYDAPITTERTLRQPKMRDDAPRALDAIISKAMSRSAEGRFQTAGEMRDALDAILSRGRAASRRALFGKIALGVVALLGLAAAAFAIMSRARPQTPAASATAPVVAVAPPPPAPTPAPIPSAPTTPAAGTKSVVSTPAKSPPAQPKPVSPPAVKAPAPVTPPADSVASTSDYLGRPVQYLIHVRRTIHEEWVRALEGYRPTGPEHAEFALSMDQTGRVTKVTTISASSQAAYEDPIESALQRVVTFGPPPPRIGRELRVEFHGFAMTVKAGGFETPTGSVR